MKHRIDCSIIILNFNTKDLTRACIASIFASRLKKYTVEVIVCDNASTDGTLTMVKKEFPTVTCIQNGGNIGFAAGNNSGIKASKGRYITLLNSDTEVKPDTFATMIQFMDAHPKAGAGTCALYLENGTLDPACHRGFPTPWVGFTYYAKLESLFPKTKLFGEYHQQYKDFTKSHEVDSISGAFFMVRREVIQEVGMLDEDYFMYGEDIDWAYRIKKAGWQIWFNPDTSILHRKKKSGRSNANRERRVKTQTLFITCNRLFYTKNFKHMYPWWVSGLVYLAFDVQLLLLKIFGI